MGDGGLDSGGIDKQWHKGGDPLYKAMRNGFVRKVYGILTAQLFMTFGMIFVVVFVGPVKKWACGSTSTDACCGGSDWMRCRESGVPRTASFHWLCPRRRGVRAGGEGAGSRRAEGGRGRSSCILVLILN